MKRIIRDTMCGTITQEMVGTKVSLNGWIQKRRDLGGVIFADVRDKSGIVQVLFPPESSVFQLAETLRSEFVIGITGTVQLRPEPSTNQKLKTKDVEIIAEDLVIYSKAETPPFPIDDDIKVDENIRMKYRYLDLRRPIVSEKLIQRHKIVKTIRNFFDDHAFTEVETPVLAKSSPEGARDYLVPSRINRGTFYALPQSPQQFKQILMVGGMERYYQIVKCFRDEDLRADRQPEFTQLDVEMSFVDVEDILALNEQLMQKLWKDVLDVDIPIPFLRMDYDEAMEKYGSDKPDTRFEMLLVDFSEEMKNVEFAVFQNALQTGGVVKAINCKGLAKLSRKEIDRLQEVAKTFGAKGLAYLLKKEGEIKSPILKFLKEEDVEAIITKMNVEEGDLVLFGADSKRVVNTVLGGMRTKLAQDHGMIDESLWNFLWITNFPLLEYDEEENRFVAVHHPFTSPVDEDIEYLTKDPARCRAKAYDLALNGYELGGGSIRIFNSELQETMFETLGFTKEEAWERFGFMLEAFKYGTPPHGGIAYGIDRITMLMTGTDNIKDVIAFPKNQRAIDQMTEAPGSVEQKQLDELFITLTEASKDE